MGIKALYRLPVDSARHEQIKILIEEYFIQNQKLINNPSRRFAEKARKALILLRKVAYERGIEILELYAESKNIGKPIITPQQKQRQPRKKKPNVS
jgi:hypothetical protein